VRDVITHIYGNGVPKSLRLGRNDPRWEGWGTALKPAAEHWIQRDEVAFWTGPFGRSPAFRQSVNPEALARLVALNYADRVRIIDGDREVLPGIGLHRVGGHTPGLQIVTVQTARGTVVLTSDASHFYRNVEKRQPVQILADLPEMLAAFETIEALAGPERLIVAGHDPQVSERFTPIDRGIIRIA